MLSSTIAVGVVCRFFMRGLTMVERRQSMRVECELPSKFRNFDSKSDPFRFSDAVVKDISRGGVRLRVDEFIPVKSELYFYLSLPNHEIIEVRIVTAWVAELPNLGKYELGARFVQVGPEQEDAIENFRRQALMRKIHEYRNTVIRDIQRNFHDDPALAA